MKKKKLILIFSIVGISIITLIAAILLIGTFAKKDNAEIYYDDLFEYSGNKIVGFNEQYQALGSISHLEIPMEYEKDGKTIPINEISIEEWLFEIEVSSLHIPSTINKIDPDLFIFLVGLEKITVDEDNESLCSIDNALYSKDKKILYHYPRNTGLYEYTLIDGVEIIEENAFYGSTLVQLNFSNTVKEVKDYAFNKSKISEIYFNNEIEKIGIYAMYDAPQVQASITENEVKYLGSKDNPYLIAWDLTEPISSNISINKSTKLILLCDSTKVLGDIELASNNKNFVFENNTIFSKDKKTLVYYFGPQIDTYTIPEEVQEVTEFAFPRNKVTTLIVNTNADIRIKSNFENIIFGEHVTNYQNIYPYNNYNITLKNPNFKVIDRSIYTSDEKTLVKIITKFGSPFTLPKTVERIMDPVISELPFGKFYLDMSIEEWLNVEIDFGQTRPIGCSSVYVKNKGGIYEELKEVHIPQSLETIDFNKIIFLSCNNVYIPNTLKEIKSSIIIDSIYFDGTIDEWKKLSGYKYIQTLDKLYLKEDKGYEKYLNYESKQFNHETIRMSVDEFNVSSLIQFPKLTSLYLSTQIKEMIYTHGNIEVENVYYEGTISDWCNIVFSSAKANPMSFCEHFFIKNESGEYIELEEIIIPKGVKSIGNYQFVSSKAKEIKIAGTVETIGIQAFSNCPNIDNIEIEDGVKAIKTCAFAGSNINCISIPKSIEYIHADAFYGDLSIINIVKEIKVDEENEHYKSIDGCLYTKDGKILIKYANGKEDDTFRVPDGVEKINTRAFIHAVNLKNIELPDSLKDINNFAFYKCTSLINLTLPNNLKRIGQAAITYTMITDIIIPESVRDCDIRIKK